MRREDGVLMDAVLRWEQGQLQIAVVTWSVVLGVQMR